MKEIGIYIHIPFCKQKCFYCDFISFTNKDLCIQPYIEKVKAEIKEKLNKKAYKVTTIYIGGGTPSYIDSKYIKELLETIKETGVEIESDIEITIEVNPGTVTQNKIKDYKEAGINRISIGMQATQNKMLKQIGRIHSYEDFLKTYKIIKKEKIKNINVDIMFGLPNQSIKDVNDTLEKVIQLKPKHISIYSLILEEGTILYDNVSKGKMELPADEKEREMYWNIKRKMSKAGYKHYEISNFAKPNYKSRHNMDCWEQKEYLGFGVAAHSYLNGERFSNVNEIEDYIEQSKFKKIINEVQDIETQMKEYMILGLRKIDGISISQFKNKFNKNPVYQFMDELNKLVEENLVKVDGDRILLTKRGLDLANVVWEEFI